MKNFKIILTASIFALMTLGFFASPIVNAQDYSANDLIPKAKIFVSPQSGTYAVGQTFQTSIYLDTMGNNINAVDLQLNFDAKKLSLINSSDGKSFFGIWLGAPKYDNNVGTISMSGVNTEGIKTNSGLIVTMTFKTIAQGSASISINDKTTAYLTDGYGSEVLVEKVDALYNISGIITTTTNISDSNSQTASSINSYNENVPIIVVPGQSRTASLVLCAILVLLLIELILYYLFRRHLLEIVKHGYDKAKNVRFEDSGTLHKKPVTEVVTPSGTHNTTASSEHTNNSHNQNNDKYSHIKHL